MNIRLYHRLMSWLEASKPIGHKRRPYKIIRIWNTLIYYIISRIENIVILRASTKMLAPKANKEKKASDIIITASLTTFPARIKEVRYAILSILLQTKQPDRVILWLAEEQFPDKQIPENLRDLCNYGLKVHFCEDLRSHKKYYYALQKQKHNELVITFDDDIIYHPHTIERLVEKHNEYPQCIICSQVHIMTFSKSGSLNTYNNWGSAQDNMGQPNKNFMPLTGSGCLYPSGIMPEITFDKQMIRATAFTADDLWIGATSRLNGIYICPTTKVARLFSVVGKSQEESLSRINCIGDGNDSTIIKLQQTFNFID